jgi:hypothetical protein
MSAAKKSWKRVPLSFRVTPEFKANIDSAAKSSGRSTAQEIEMRLEASFRDDAVMERLDRIERALTADADAEARHRWVEMEQAILEIGMITRSTRNGG